MVGRNAGELIKALPGFTPITGLDNKPGYNGEAIGINGNGDGGSQSPIGKFSANGTRAETLDIVADGRTFLTLVATAPRQSIRTRI